MAVPPRPKPRPCPPGFVRPVPSGPCVRPGFVTPFGGPASGLWPSGRAGPQTPLPSCTGANFLSDCFAHCVGTITPASPGPVCGWTYDSVFGSGPITFTPGFMTVQSPGFLDEPMADKNFASSLIDIINTTLQFQFSEFPDILGDPNTAYVVIITNFDLSKCILILLFSDGTVIFQLGPTLNATNYTGTWSPNNGTHTVHVTIDAMGIPSLFVDGVSIPLAFLSMGPSFAQLFPPNIMSLGAGNGTASPSSMSYEKAFLAAGIFPPDTVFCCPP